MCEVLQIPARNDVTRRDVMSVHPHTFENTGLTTDESCKRICSNFGSFDTASTVKRRMGNLLMLGSAYCSCVRTAQRSEQLGKQIGAERRRHGRNNMRDSS